MTPPTDRPMSFANKHREICAAAIELQADLKRALDEIVPGERGARSIARRLSIDKNLGWQMLRIVNSPDPAPILAALPGKLGLRAMIDALTKHGASDAAIRALHASVAGIQDKVERLGASPREIVAIASGGLETEHQRRTLQRMLKLHFESTVAIRGETAAAEASAWIVTPSKQDPALATLAGLYMVTGLRTIRPLGPRIIYRGATVASGVATSDFAAVEVGRGQSIPFLVPQASSPDLDRESLALKSTPRGQFILADPDTQPDGLLTLGFADRFEAVGSIHRTETDRTAEVSCQLALPVKHVFLDLLYDKSMPAVEPSASLYFSAAQGIEHGEYAELRRFTGEVEGRFVRSVKLPASSGMDVERHLALLEHGASLVGRPLDAFRCYRMHLIYPPTYTRAVVRWLLPEKAKA